MEPVNDALLASPAVTRNTSSARPVGIQRHKSSPFAANNESVECSHWVNEKGVVVGHDTPPLLHRLCPFLVWLLPYKSSFFKGDLVAGLSVGVMVIPQGLAHASIAGVSPVLGLYCALVPLYVYAALGTSRAQAIGTGAVVALLAGGQINHLPAEALDAASIVLGFLVGCIHIIMGLFDMGRITNFLSRPVMSGFTTGAAFIIMGGQLKHLFGVPAPRSAFFFVDLWNVVSAFDTAVPAACATGVCSVAILRLFKKGKQALKAKPKMDPDADPDDDDAEPIMPTFLCMTGGPGAACGTRAFLAVADFSALVVVLCGVCVGAILHLAAADTSMSIVGAVPQGAPPFRVPWEDLASATGLGAGSNDTGSGGTLGSGSSMDRRSAVGSGSSLDRPDSPASGSPSVTELVFSLIPGAFVVALVSFMTSIAGAKKFALRDGYTVDANQELLAMGVAGGVGSFFGAFPIQGSLSRTAVNALNARTQLASVISATCVLLGLLFLMPALFYLPKASLAGIILVAGSDLLDFATAKWLYRFGTSASERQDLWMWSLAFLTTISVGVVYGIMVSVGVSLALIIAASVHPDWSVLGRLPNTNVYRSVTAVSHLQPRTIAGVVLFRWHAPLHFANSSSFKDTLSDIIIRKNISLRKAVEDAAVESMPTSASAMAQATHDRSRATSTTHGRSRAASRVADGKSDSILSEVSIHVGGEVGLEVGDVDNARADAEEEAALPGSRVSCVVLDMSSVAYVDATAAQFILEMFDEYASRHIEIVLANTKHSVRSTLGRCGIAKRMVEENSDHFEHYSNQEAMDLANRLVYGDDTEMDLERGGGGGGGGGVDPEGIELSAPQSSHLADRKSSFAAAAALNSLAVGGLEDDDDLEWDDAASNIDSDEGAEYTQQ